MTVGTSFTSWNRGRQPGKPFDHASPALDAIQHHVRAAWPMTFLGCYGVRPIRGGTAWSSHAFGAAVDLGYKHDDRPIILDKVIPWMIANSGELGIQRIHDYIEKRYWQAGQGWIMRPPGIGGLWLHVEITPEKWSDLAGVTKALGGKPVPTSSVPYPGRTLKAGSSGKAVEAVQAALGLKVDGKFGPVTEKAVRKYQESHNLVTDGCVGPVTWAQIFRPNA